MFMNYFSPTPLVSPLYFIITKTNGLRDLLAAELYVFPCKINHKMKTLQKLNFQTTKMGTLYEKDDPSFKTAEGTDEDISNLTSRFKKIGLQVYTIQLL